MAQRDQRTALVTRHLYRLDANGEPEPVKDVLGWGEWFESANRTVAFDELEDGVQVSTVFLGINHGYGPGAPILWETMMFNADGRGKLMVRYTTRVDALSGHIEIVNEIRRGPTREE